MKTGIPDTLLPPFAPTLKEQVVFRCGHWELVWALNEAELQYERETAGHFDCVSCSIQKRIAYEIANE